MFAANALPSWKIRIEAPKITHLIQAGAQLSVYICMAAFSTGIRFYLPWILIQLIFAFALEGLLNWRESRELRLNFAVVPIVLSVNLFLWFRTEYFYLQLLMIAFAVASKRLFIWRRDGRPRHIFNPSGIAMALATFLIVWFTPVDWIYLQTLENNYLFARPLILAVIFAAGCFPLWAGRTFMISAGAILTWIIPSAILYFITGMPLAPRILDPAVFLGMTLLITDPASTPKGNLNQFLYGMTYAIAVLLGYGLLSAGHAPGYFAKILPLPLMNLLTPLFDRIHPQSETSRRPFLLTAYSILFSGLVMLFWDVPRLRSHLGKWGGERWSATMAR